MELNHLRKLELRGKTPPWFFFQLKFVFQFLESVRSARIEGNHTTISEYVDNKISENQVESDSLSEIHNIEKAMTFIEENISYGDDITHHFIRKLHEIATQGLKREGDRTPGCYRSWGVKIAKSKHTPPEPYSVMPHMDELIEFLNKDDADKYDLLKTAIAHHRLAWIHPFGNGNGRVVRLLTYALMIKYGFNVKEGQILNPTAVFCSNRDNYYTYLAKADTGTDKGLLEWCEYVLSGILLEINKVNRLLEFEYLKEKVLFPTLDRALSEKHIDKVEYGILNVGIELGSFKSSDISDMAEGTMRNRSYIINKMKEKKLIQPLEQGRRKYVVSLVNNVLLRSLVKSLEANGFIPERID
jgi:Fic family protein